MKTDHPKLIELALYQTGEYPCSYLPAHTARSQMVAPLDAIDTHNYSQLINQGFRRSGLHVYRPNCAQCQACISTRIVAEQFEPNRSQRRTFKKWQHLHTQVCELEFKPEHFDLYQRYQKTRHSDGEMAKDDVAQYRQFLLHSRVNSFLVEFRDDTGKLLMVSLIDSTAQGLSAVYTFYEPSSEYSGLGTYGILWQVSVAQRLQLPYIYLGYWIEGSDKMAYKAKFAATQFLLNGVWQERKSQAV
jgi:arginyl-tRNA--protein-N-Asp/Glu arginylyltransferase